MLHVDGGNRIVFRTDHHVFFNVECAPRSCRLASVRGLRRTDLAVGRVLRSGFLLVEVAKER